MQTFFSMSVCYLRDVSESLSLVVPHRKMLFETPEEDANYNPLPEERPGGFPWGEGQRLGG